MKVYSLSSPSRFAIWRSTSQRNVCGLLEIMGCLLFACVEIHSVPPQFKLAMTSAITDLAFRGPSKDDAPNGHLPNVECE